MNEATLKELALIAHEPACALTNSQVYEVWQDGEITLTKAGDLFRHRTLHMMAHPILQDAETIATVHAIWLEVNGQRDTPNTSLIMDGEPAAKELVAAIAEFASQR